MIDVRVGPIREVTGDRIGRARADAESRALGECEHDIRHGVKDDAKDVYSIDRAQLAELEHDHVCPYIRSKHVVKYGLFGHDLHLVPIETANEDNENELRNDCPGTYGYLEANRQTLEERPRPGWTTGRSATCSGWVRTRGRRTRSSGAGSGSSRTSPSYPPFDDEDLGEKTVIPGDRFMFISTDDEREAHFLCALLNSSVYQQSMGGIASEEKSSLSKAVVSRLELPGYRGTGCDKRLAELSMEAHGIVPEHTDANKRTYNDETIEELKVIQGEIDALVEEMLSGGSPFSCRSHLHPGTLEPDSARLAVSEAQPTDAASVAPSSVGPASSPRPHRSRSRGLARPSRRLRPVALIPGTEAPPPAGG